MKTYQEILVDIAEKQIGYVSGTEVNVRTMAAKEYAKMWVRKALEETHDTRYVTALVEEYNKEIDAQ